MRHQKSGRKLGRNSSHRKAMYRNMVTSLLRHERITTTVAKAKELRGEVERAITVGVRLGDLLDKPKDERTRDEQARYAHALAHVAKTVQDREIVHKLFEDIAPRVRNRPGGYTRVIRLGQRRGDAAEMAIIELVDRKIPESDGAGDSIS
ncbi:LSU ribosomal protein L17p [Enhygromyxa salina]|uniref:Large ribosomal subunit protein bL17 n=1 Tax=Enhygromyxa salina TaxID=215803 RepID=A0A0C2D6X1_9BACT|nr:50S ribosomal protein L17 [Enhygromyxa salina]KIG15767.1 LSU ribosomal protein L17p [Enhygromyxa salina]